MIALIAFVVTMLPLSAFAEARTSFIRSRNDSRPARPDSGIEIVPHKTENPKRSAIWDGSIAAGFAGGSGTEDDPYLISNGSELAYLAQQVNSGNRYENVHFKLTNDIYLNDTTDWELWGTTDSSSAGKADTCNGSAIEPTKQDEGGKMDEPIAIPVRPAPKTELESDTLSDALNAAGQSNTFVSTGSYPWQVDSTTYDGRTAAKSGNYNVSSSTSSFSTTGGGGFSDSADITVCYAPANTWIAIGTESNRFYGCFDGNGYAVRGIYINTQESFQGLFGFGKCSVIANLGVAESYIYGDTYVGGVVGYNGAGYNGVEYSGGTVTGCYNEGNITGKRNVGCVVGYNGGTVTDCYNTGDVTGKYYAGGVFGENGGTVTDCYNTGNVTGKEDVGGVVGKISRAHV